MGLEIEKKFLVISDAWRQGVKGVYYRQGYLSSNPERTVRIRTVEDKAYLTVKGKSKGAVRSEYEYPIPYADAVELLNHICEKPVIEKIRYKIMYSGLLWEVDQFAGENIGLIIAEVELTDETQTVELPPWVGAEVTTEEKYYNSNLIKYPFSKW